MNQTKVQYAVIAHKELLQAKRKVDFWSAHLTERLETLNDAEITEFKKRAGGETIS
jgi:hypothetical protein